MRGEGPASSVGETNEKRANESGSDARGGQKSTSNLKDAELNFTWEHFLVEKCGVNRTDALRYEANLIAHRVSPEDTLVEYMQLIGQVGQIAVGDRIKVVKTVQRQEAAMRKSRQEAQRARELLGLGQYSPVEAQIILDLATCDDDELDIERGIEEWEESRWELDRMAAIGHVRSGLGQLSSRIDYDGAEASLAKRNEPAMLLLLSFGYTSFDYMKDKRVGPAAVCLPYSSSQPRQAGEERPDHEISDEDSAEDETNSMRS